MTPVFVRINYAVEIPKSAQLILTFLDFFIQVDLASSKHNTKLFSLVSEHHLCKSFSQPFVADSRQIWFESFQKFLKTKIERRYLRTNICAEMRCHNSSCTMINSYYRCMLSNLTSVLKKKQCSSFTLNSCKAFSHLVDCIS